MGSGGSKSHESFAVAPAAPADSAVSQASVGDSVQITGYSENAAAGLAAISGAGDYQQMSGAVGDMMAKLSDSDMPQLAADTTVGIHTASKEWLQGRTKEELDELAAAQGFPHPEHVSHKALVYWLDPSYPAGLPSKAAIAAKSIERYNEAVASGKLSVVPEPDMPQGFWEATPAAVLEAQTDFFAALEQSKTGHTDERAQAVLDLIEAENKLATAYCPELGDTLAGSKAQAAEMVNAQVGDDYSQVSRTAVKKAIAAEQLPEGARLLDPASGLALLRQSTPESHKTQLGEVIANREQVLAGAVEAKETLQGLTGGSMLDKPYPLSKNDLVNYQHAAGQYQGAQGEWVNWGPTTGSKPSYVSEDVFAQGLRHGAKTMPIADLRGAAEQLGMDPDLAESASRAQLQNWMIGKWHSNIEPSDIEAAIKAKKYPKSVATPTITPSSPTASVAAASAGTTAAVSNGSVTPLTAGSGTWLAKQKQTVAALRHQVASLSDMPARPAASDVASWNFAKGPEMSLGGMHSKSVRTAPDGSLWMFKELKENYAVSEAGANGILHRVGIPTVPVYPHKIGAQSGTVQPLMKGASTFSSDPQKWSQGDVDAIVRYHAAAWVIGDHDAKSENVLRTPSGGMVPIDHGQAFRYWGRDELSTSYNPNGSYGASAPVWNVLYAAAKEGKLAKGVRVRPEAATPVIKAFEAVSDAEYSAMLTPIAKAGATAPLCHWKPAMEKIATAKTGGKANAAQVVDAFVNYGLDRKNNVRKSFLKFFSENGIDGADIIAKAA
ncbi:Uncharacterised protein [Mycobacteroides abscessus]|uniref:Uncharacterized protein n=1 Tax=Mycobacteroides abscessus TaxID=36809 RepID=A0A0U0ZQW5_9MYCO|nr:Uncharacterised protein [Mycobacteroides abscessus]